MAYVKNTWVDQEGQVRYRETQDGDFKILTPNYEQVTEIGTPVNADNMNHIEDGIVENDAAITTINSKIPNNATSLNKMVTQLDLDGKADIDLSNTNPSQSFINSVKSWINYAPDYSNATTVSYSSGQAVGFDGWLAVDGSVSGLALTGWVAINGIKFCTNYRGNQDGGGATFAGITMVRATDVITMQYFSGTIYKIPFVGGNA